MIKALNLTIILPIAILPVIPQTFRVCRMMLRTVQRRSHRISGTSMYFTKKRMSGNRRNDQHRRSFGLVNI